MQMAEVFTSEESTEHMSAEVPPSLRVDASGGEESQMFHVQRAIERGEGKGEGRFRIEGGRSRVRAVESRGWRIEGRERFT